MCTTSYLYLLNIFLQTFCWATDMNHFVFRTFHSIQPAGTQTGPFFCVNLNVSIIILDRIGLTCVTARLIVTVSYSTFSRKFDCVKMIITINFRCVMRYFLSSIYSIRTLYIRVHKCICMFPVSLTICASSDFRSDMSIWCE